MNPLTGRFWTQDAYEGGGSDPQSLHKYLYAGTDPTNQLDPSGYTSISETSTTQGIIGRTIRMATFRFNAYSRASAASSGVQFAVQLATTGTINPLLAFLTCSASSYRSGKLFGTAKSLVIRFWRRLPTSVKCFNFSRGTARTPPSTLVSLVPLLRRAYCGCSRQTSLRDITESTQSSRKGTV